jgi:hypothetical protein
LFNKVEIEAKERGFKVLENGDALNNKGKKVGGRYNGYIATSFRSNGKIKHFMTHRLQAYQKFGNKIYEEGIVARHLDGNPLNNSCNNIEIGTTSDNMMDIPKEVRIKKASNANKKHSDETVKDIRKDRKSGMTYKELMYKYGISSKGTMSFIVNKRL